MAERLTAATWSIACGLAACLVLASTAFAALPGDNGDIAFVQPGDAIYTIDPDGNDANQIVPGGEQPAWSPGGSRLAYVDGSSIYTVNPDGSGQALVLDTGAPAVQGIAWSPDASQLAFAACISGECDVYTVNANGTGLFNLTQDPANDYFPAWSPEGSVIAYASAPPAGPADTEIEVIDTEGAVRATLTNNTEDDSNPNWSPDGSQVVFDRGPAPQLFVMSASGSGQHAITTGDSTEPSSNPAWSPSGDEIVFAGKRNAAGQGLFAVDPVSGVTRFILPVMTSVGTISDAAPDWQPLTPHPGGYPRPKSANAVQASLVPAYAQCTAANSMHGPPLEFFSCAPPQRISPNLTVGTADSNGAASQSVGRVRMHTLLGDPVTPEDEADVVTDLIVTDVRNASGLTDYTGELDLEVTVQITDRNNTPGSGIDAHATVTDFPLSFTVPCTPTPQPDVGSFCELETGLDVLTGGAVRERQRSIWQLGRAELYDGGVDGLASTQPNALFMTQGVFIP